MITIISGDDTSASRKYFQDLKKETKDSYSFDGKKVELSDLVQVLEGGSLFQTEKNVFIEDFIAGRKDSKDKDGIEKFLSKRKDTMNLYLWENKDVSKLKNPLTKSATLKTFNLPKMLFTFLDSLKPNSLQNVLLFHETLVASDEQLIFSMLIRQFRLLLAIENTSTNQIDEVKRLAPWQSQKLRNQARLFKPEKLQKAYQKLFAIDLAQKTSASGLGMRESIDIFLLSL